MICGYVFDDLECREQGEHFCTPRANKAQRFFEELLLHTKGPWVRKKFILDDWQREEIIRPLFGRVVWSEAFECYRRRYEIAWIEMARKQGKTEILAGIMLYLLAADGEQSGEVYGVARNIDQARLCFDVAAQMVKFSPALSAELSVSDYKKRIIHKRTNSFYQVIAADAKSALGTNPSGVGADEICAWDKGDLWSSMRTGMGARVQPLMVAITTAGNDTEGFAGNMHKRMEVAIEHPDEEENYHIFVYMKNTPMDADPWDEANWPIANPALGSFLTWEGMRKQAAEAKHNPIEEMAFRQFKLNQWQPSTVRWMNMHYWDQPANISTIYRNNKDLFKAYSYENYECWFGLDLAAKHDLCSICYLFPSDDPTYGVDVLWRHWMCEATFKKLDRLNNGRFTEFVKNGWLQVHDGDVLDFQQFYADIQEDSKRFVILGGDVDKWSSEPVVQEVRLRTGIGVNDIFAYDNQFVNMSDGMHRIFDMVMGGLFRWHGNPLARFCFDACEAKYKLDDPDQIKPVKPDRLIAAKRIDAVPAAVMAVNAWTTRDNTATSMYAEEDVFIL